jgi:hypothetical protein
VTPSGSEQLAQAGPGSAPREGSYFGARDPRGPATRPGPARLSSAATQSCSPDLASPRELAFCPALLRCLKFTDSCPSSEGRTVLSLVFGRADCHSHGAYVFLTTHRQK